MGKQDIDNAHNENSYMEKQNIETALVNVCSTYWNIRNSGDVSGDRSDAHEDVLSLFRALRIPFDDREDAAQLAKEIKNNAIPAARYVALLLRNNDATH